MEFGILLVILVAIGIAIAFRLFAGSMDRERLRQYVEARGGRVIDATWAPFGPGWFGGNKERIYQVRYLDHDGNVHEAYARTSMWTGVYFTEDLIIKRGKPPIGQEEVESLEEENARLRSELERLKRKEKDKNSDAFQE
jgi:HAMP domain-containing protein